MTNKQLQKMQFRLIRIPLPNSPAHAIPLAKFPTQCAVLQQKVGEEWIDIPLIDPDLC